MQIKNNLPKRGTWDIGQPFLPFSNPFL